MRRENLLPLIAISLFLTGCSSVSEYQRSHEEVVQAVTKAMAEEGKVDPAHIRRTERSGPGQEHWTLLDADYTHYSRAHAQIRNTGGASDRLELEVRTGETVNTRHKDWEERILTRVGQLLQPPAKHPDTRPSELPPVPPPAPKALPPNVIYSPPSSTSTPAPSGSAEDKSKKTTDDASKRSLGTTDEKTPAGQGAPQP